METRARSTRVAAVVSSVRSDARRGDARHWERAWTRVRDQERVNARTRQVMQVVMFWRRLLGRRLFLCGKKIN
jgi:hypothetical protein